MSVLNHAKPPPASAQYHLSGQYLARARRLTRLQRANLAAALASGTATVFLLTVTQAATLAKAPMADVSRARRNGNPVKPRRSKETLAAHILRSSRVELVEAARAVGIDVIWDTMISPVISEERTADINATA